MHSNHRPIVVLAAVLVAAAAQAQTPDYSKVEIKAQHVAGSVYMLTGAGGNIGVSAGDDGVVLIDDQFAPLSDKIKAAVAAISSRPIRFLINTHWHGDHTGGNENFAKSGILIVAQENVRKRLSAGQVNELFDRTVPAAPAGALPVVTFTDAIAFHLNGDDADAVHVPPAHTDGDAYVHFRKADVVHTGDLFFNGTYPVIDVPSGGSFAGLIAAADRLLQVIGPDTKLIPGHGPLGTPADLRAYRDMLAQVRERVAPMVKAGKTADEVIAAKPTADLDAKWGQGYMTPARFLRAVHMSLLRERP